MILRNLQKAGGYPCLHSLVSILVFLFWLDIYKLSQVLLVALLA